MAETTYDIIHSDGKSSILVNEIVGDSTSCSLNLIGKNQPIYGKAQNENFLHLLENFASPTPPKNPTVGQIWFEEVLVDGSYTGSYNLKICVDTSLSDPWVKVPQVVVSDVEPLSSISSEGDMWYDTENNEFKIFDSVLGWLKIGPENYEHKDSTYTEQKQTGSGVIEYKIDRELFSPKINEKVETTSLGSISLVKMKVLSKEVYTSLEAQGNKEPKCKVWEYAFVVQSISTGTSSYDVKLVGTPTYSIIAASDETTNWNVQIYRDIDSETGTSMIYVKTQTNPSSVDSYVVSYIGIEVEKV